MPSDSYKAHRDRAADRQAEQTREGRDIGPPPRCRNKRRRERCRSNLRKHLETYHAPAFPLAWSDDHLALIHDIERAVLQGQLKAVAMPRGSGKTTILERAILWAVLHGHHLYAFLLAATNKLAIHSLDEIKTELMGNDLLLEDFPELIHPLRALEWIANRARGQHIDGVPTLVKWDKDQVVLPTIEDRPGAVIKCGGLLTAVRGSKTTHPNGQVVRPSIALIDDPQTRRSAKSLVQSDERAQIVSGDVLGMAGPGKPFSALLTCTVIQRGDFADRILNRDLHPHWHGQRTKMLESFPERMDLWEHYRELLLDELRADGDGAQATKFYRKHRKSMDAGSRVSWKERFHAATEISAVQHAMNLWIKDQDAFFSEYQNDPLDLTAGDAHDLLSAEEIAQRVNPFARNVVPADAQTITAFIDVQDALLYFVVVAWADDFTGYVVDYGTWPQQAASYFTLRSAKATLQRKWPQISKEARLRKALDALFDANPDARASAKGSLGGLMRREWKRQGDGATLQVKLCLVDGNYLGQDVVYPAIAASPHRSRIIPAHGKGVTSRQTPFAEYQRKPGEKRGLHWFIPKKSSGKSLRHIVPDVNFWKSAVHNRLATDPAERGSLTLYKAQAKRHAMIADHLTAESVERREGRGRTVDEWSQRPGADNHLFDCLVGCAVAASVEGCELSIAGVPTPKKKRTAPRESLAERRARKRRGRR